MFTAEVPAASVADDQVRTLLAAIPELDLASGLHAVRGRLPTYLRVLRLFVDSHVDDTKKLRELIESGRFKEAEAIAHALKGAAGNIGATALSRLAEAMQAALRKSAVDEIGRLLAALEVQVPNLLSGLGNALNVPAMTNTGLHRAAHGSLADDLRRALHELRQSLTDDDLAACRQFAALRDDLVRVRGEAEILRIEAAIVRFAYAEALVQLEGLDA